MCSILQTRTPAKSTQQPVSRTMQIVRKPSASEAGIVRVKDQGIVRDFSFIVGMANSETTVTLRRILRRIGETRQDVQTITIDESGKTFCLCNDHFNDSTCIHSALSAAVVRELDKLTQAETAQAEASKKLYVRSAINGEVLAVIESNTGLSAVHYHIAKTLAAKPHLLAQADAIAAPITGCTIRQLSAF